MTEEQEDILALYGVPGVGAKMFTRLVARLGSAAAVFSASKKELILTDGIGPILAENILRHDRKSFIRDQKRRMEKVDAKIITRSSKEYPPLLNIFHSAPPVLFIRGDIQTLNAPLTIAVVGTRRPTNWGVSMTRKLLAGAVSAGFCVVSGMAAGIDSAAHRTALDDGGITVAVFGCGVDIIYPSVNRRLSEDIMKSGCLVSHFPMGTACNPGNFPARNSVIVGMSLGTIVVEAPQKSGALITANLTLKAGRTLFAVPGNADSLKSEGANSLLVQGAHPVMTFDNVISFFGKPVSSHTDGTSSKIRYTRPLPPGLGGKIVKTLAEKPLHVETLCTKLGEPISRILTELTMLEIDGYVTQQPGKIFERI